MSFTPARGRPTRGINCPGSETAFDIPGRRGQTRVGSKQRGNAVSHHLPPARGSVRHPLSTFLRVSWDKLYCASQNKWARSLHPNSVLGFGHQSNLPGPTQASSVHSACPTAHSQHHPWMGAKKHSYPTVQSKELGPLYSSCPMDTGSNPHSVTHCSGPWSSVLTPQPACLKHGDSTRPEEALSPAPL